jgi:ribokinase
MVSHIVREIIRFPDREIGPVLGGPTAYCSVIAAKLGARVGIVTPIGDDMSQSLLAPFAEVGVDTRGLCRVGPHSTNSILVYNTQGDKEILYPWRAPEISFHDIPSAYLTARAMHIAPMDYDVGLETLRALRAHIPILSADLGGYGGAHSRTHPTQEEQRDPRALCTLVGHFDIIRASIEDCRHLLGETGVTPADLPRRFVAWGGKVGIVTLGSQGAAVATREGAFTVPALPGSVVDTTGAGDSFSAGFLVEYLRTQDAQRAARFATAVARHVIGSSGGVLAGRMPAPSEVEALLKSTGCISR